MGGYGNHEHMYYPHAPLRVCVALFSLFCIKEVPLTIMLHVSATIRGKILFHLFSEVFCQSCTLGFVPLFPKSVGHTVSENIYLFTSLCHRIPLYPKHYFILKNHENLRKGS